MSLLDGQHAIVTGGARGIGKSIAARFLADGAKVTLCDIDGAAAAATARELGDERRIQAITCDMRRATEIDALFLTAQNAFGPVDIMVNNAGVVAPKPFLELDEATFDHVIDVNLKGVFLGAQAAGRAMLERVKAGGPAGAIVNMASVMARLASDVHVAYCASKAGVAHMTTAMAMALAPHQIRVNAVAPGSIATDMLNSMMQPGVRDMILSRTPLGRIAGADEIAAVVAFLASRESSYITGQTIFVDGGRTGLAFTMPKTL